MSLPIWQRAACLAALVVGGGGADALDMDNHAIDYPDPQASVERQARLQWFSEARFGMFVHWGLYAIPAGDYQGKKVPGIGEWIMKTGNIPTSEYEELCGQFDPVTFNAEAWAALAKRTGMKYLLITAKHHDGFCLWDSRVTDYDIVDRTPFSKDIIRALAGACERQGIKLCLYYSILDWHHPDVSYRTAKADRHPDRYVQEYMKPQLAELLSGEYGRIDMLWFDGWWESWWTPEMGRDVYDFVHELNPQVIVNDRLRSGDYIIGDYVTPEQNIPAVPTSSLQPGARWETVMTMNNTWGYRADDRNWKSPRELIRTLIEVASRGGNLTLNVGPDARGRIPPESVEALNAIGQWMEVNGEALYGTSHSPFGCMPWGRITAKRDTLYLHVFEWPRQELALRLDHWRNRKVTRVHLLASPETSLDYHRAGVELRFAVPQPPPDPIASVIAVEFEPGNMAGTE